VDQEGGLVDRLRRVLAPMPAPAKLRTAEDAARLGALISEALRILGFNMDFAPVVDVIDEQRSCVNNGLVSRASGKNEQDVVEFSGRFLDQLNTGGITGCVKHFPGLGASKVDSHEELPSVEIGSEELFERDLFPYRATFEHFGDSVAVMAGHAAYPNIDLQETDQNGKLLPSSLSFSIVTGLLRNQLNFNGLVISDDLEMGAILKNYGIADACVMAIDAGVDMLAICADADRIVEGYNTVLDTVKSGRIARTRLDESLERIERMRKQLRQPLPFDPDRLAAIADEIAEFNSQLK
jgi:beta-N-acetylhexosaminidase